VDLPFYLQAQFIEAITRGPVMVSLPGLGSSSISLPMLSSFSPSMLQALGDCAEPRFGPSPHQLRAAAQARLDALSKQEMILKAEVSGKEVERAAKKVKDLRDAAARAALAGSLAVARVESARADEAEREALLELGALRKASAAMEAERTALAEEMKETEKKVQESGASILSAATNALKELHAAKIAAEKEAFERAREEVAERVRLEKERQLADEAAILAMKAAAEATAIASSAAATAALAEGQQVPALLPSTVIPIFPSVVSSYHAEAPPSTGLVDVIQPPPSPPQAAASFVKASPPREVSITPSTDASRALSLSKVRANASASALLESALATMARNTEESENRARLERELAASEKQVREAALSAARRAIEAKAAADAAATAAIAAGDKLAKIEAGALEKEIARAEEVKATAERIQALNLATLNAEKEAEAALGELNKLRDTLNSRALSSIAGLAATALTAAISPSSTSSHSPVSPKPLTGTVGIKGSSSSLTPPPFYIPPQGVSPTASSLVTRSNAVSMAAFGFAEARAASLSQSFTRESASVGIKTPTRPHPTFSPTPYTEAIQSASSTLRYGLSSPSKASPLPLPNSSYSAALQNHPKSPTLPFPTNKFSDMQSSSVTVSPPQPASKRRGSFAGSPSSSLPPSPRKLGFRIPLGHLSTKATSVVELCGSWNGASHSAAPFFARNSHNITSLSHLTFPSTLHISVEWNVRVPLVFRTSLPGGPGFICRLQMVPDDSEASGKWIESIEGEPLLLLSHGTYTCK